MTSVLGIRPASPEQKKKIAQLCMALKIREPMEENKMTSGEAGRLIRKMLEELKARRRPLR